MNRFFFVVAFVFAVFSYSLPRTFGEEPKASAMVEASKKAPLPGSQTPWRASNEYLLPSLTILWDFDLPDDNPRGLIFDSDLLGASPFTTYPPTKKSVTNVRTNDRTILAAMIYDNVNDCDFSKSRFAYCCFGGGAFRNCSFKDAQFIACAGNTLRRATFDENCDLSGAYFRDCSGIRFIGEQFRQTKNFEKKELFGLSDIDGHPPVLRDVDLSGFILRKVSFIDAENCSLTDADLAYCGVYWFTRPRLESTLNYRNKILIGVHFKLSGDLRFTRKNPLDLRGIDLSGFDLSGCVFGDSYDPVDFTDANFTDAKITNCHFANCVGLTLEQMRSTWNWKNGAMESVFFQEILSDNVDERFLGFKDKVRQALAEEAQGQANGVAPPEMKNVEKAENVVSFPRQDSATTVPNRAFALREGTLNSTRGPVRAFGFGNSNAAPLCLIFDSNVVDSLPFVVYPSAKKNVKNVQTKERRILASTISGDTKDCDFSKSSFTTCFLGSGTFHNSSFKDAGFVTCGGDNVKFDESCDLTNAYFYNCWGVRLTSEQFRQTENFEKKVLYGFYATEDEEALLRDVDLSGFLLRRVSTIDAASCSLDGAALERCGVIGMTRDRLESTFNYRHKTLFGIYFFGGDLRGIDLSGFNLSDCVFGDADRPVDLTDVNFTDANISNSCFDNCVGLTIEQLRTTWNWKNGVMDCVYFSNEPISRDGSRQEFAPEFEHFQDKVDRALAEEAEQKQEQTPVVP